MKSLFSLLAILACALMLQSCYYGPAYHRHGYYRPGPPPPPRGHYHGGHGHGHHHGW